MNSAADPRKVTVVTGASDGIGADLARVFAAKGHEVVLVARRRDRLDALSNEIVAAGAPKPLVVALDLCESGAVDALEHSLREAGLTVEILVNNAGFGLIGPSIGLDRVEQLAMVDLNVRALTELTLRFQNEIAAARGAILNVASIAAFMPGPNFAIYYASKAYVRSFSEGLAQEMAPLGVKVSCLCPGPVETGFQARAGMAFEGAMSSMKPALVPSAEVARQGYEGLMAGKRIIVPGNMNKIMLAMVQITPRAVLMPMLAYAQKGR
ncbi:MAG: SDR family oxidoreductase [Methylocystis sp.]